MPAYIAVGAAAGLCRLVKETEGNKSAEVLLCETAGLQEGDPLVSLIMDAYDLLTGGAEIAALRRTAEQKKAHKDIV